jgi:hypothetical protein
MTTFRKILVTLPQYHPAILNFQDKVLFLPKVSKNLGKNKRKIDKNIIFKTYQSYSKISFSKNRKP